MSVNMSGSWAVGLGVGVGSYHPGIYVPLKALFLVFGYNNEKCQLLKKMFFLFLLKTLIVGSH